MSRPEEVVANVLEPWTGVDILAVAEAVLEALEAAGYAVVPSHRVIPETKLQIHINPPPRLGYVRPDPYDPMS